MKQLTTTINELNSLVLEGRMLEAFDRFYHDDVVMQENNLEPTVGKMANRKREEIFLGNILEFRGAAPLQVTSGDDVTMVVWSYDYTHKEWGERKYTQVSVQTWKEGKIIKEQFFYGN